ncbi:DNA primase [Nitratiruptor sp. SB155-2]|uniref:DNA primase n=1 Tax=Nitratiruptor sp. (strain SB155-2) TaxID=387092 RepID=UPI0002E41810|nr:DNA primase [Nitratiruptor sp. SB155-2]
MIDQNSIEQLKNIVDIVDVIGNYIELKKAGSNYKALCPFHQEDTPSFVVSPSKQIFHCFGCGAGGDAIKFLMEYEKLSYPEAIEKLAGMYNFSLQRIGSKESSSNLFKALESINRLYKKELFSKKKALDYLKQRGVANNSIEKFELGYAPEGNTQIQYLKKEFIPLQDAIQTGILSQDSGRVYARLVERITFPIYSPNGALVGFGGRTITNHPAKYLNSPETKLFHKSKILYGYHLAKQEIYKKKELIVCEGYLDVVMLHQAGFQNAVATLGTALTPSHLPLLRKGEPRVILAYDGDRAGIEAALKASKMLTKADIEGGVVIFTQDQDPADMVKKAQLQELQRLFAKPIPFVEFVLEKTVQKYDIKNPREKEKALFEGIDFLKTLSPLLQEEYKEYLAALLNILPSKIVLHPQQKKDVNYTMEVHDPKELSIIKTMLTKPHTVDIILDIIDASHFTYHQEEFELTLQNRVDHPKIRSILLNEDILVFEEEHIRSELLVFLIKYYEQKIQEVVKGDFPFNQKSFLIRKYKENIKRLKEGELIIE